MATRTKRRRLDELLVIGRHAADRAEAEILIRSGRVLVADVMADKPGSLYPEDAPIRIKQRSAYVSRGGLKLEAALLHFDIRPQGWVCADIGASSGGFTDCLLQHGARRVYAIDVAYGQLDWKLRTDQRVVVLERLNVRKLTAGLFDEPLDLAVFDTSFISLQQVIPPVLPFFGRTVRIVALVKPQFELPRNRVGEGGIVRDEQARLDAVEMVRRFGEGHRLSTRGFIPSPIKGPKGNQEYLIQFERS